MARQALQFLDSKRRESSTSVDEGGLQLSSAEKKKEKLFNITTRQHKKEQTQPSPPCPI